MKTFKTSAIVALMTATVGLAAIVPSYAQQANPPAAPAAEQAPGPGPGPMRPESMVEKPEQPLAIMLPAWKEFDVIATMVVATTMRAICSSSALRASRSAAPEK